MPPSSNQTIQVELPIECFSDVIARQQVLFSLLGLRETSGRVQRWLAKRGKKALNELSFSEYEALCRSVQKLWDTDQHQISVLIAQTESLFQQIALDWNHPIIQAFLHSDAVQDEGLTPQNLKRLCEALQTEINGD